MSPPRIEAEGSLAFGDWLTEYTAFLTKHSIYRNTKVQFAKVAPWAGETPSGPRNEFHHQ